MHTSATRPHSSWCAIFEVEQIHTDTGPFPHVDGFLDRVEHPVAFVTNVRGIDAAVPRGHWPDPPAGER